MDGTVPADDAAVPGPDASSDALYAWLERTAALPVYADSTARQFVPTSINSALKWAT
ncbi:hypothetical protein ACFWIA_01490 [Streptomyces sp. NPDC127068]|uniref:hypothetical protein n=1 Tax=Streptomyces sp. NPDC127068 TaxID=3347127 RepID=UPI0036472461